MESKFWSTLALRELGELANALFPPACALCGGASDADMACVEHRIPPANRRARCDRCSALHPPSLPDGARCAACRLSPPAWSALFSLADYGLDPALRTWVLALKHGGRRDLAQPLGELLAQALRASSQPADWLDTHTCVSSVPLHASRHFVRGFDQAGLLARYFALEMGLPCVQALKRIRATTPQGAPGSSSRSANVRGAFVSRDNALVRGRTVLLVDDVVTSGATADECARCLRRAGAARVVVICLARASSVLKKEP